MDKRVLSIAGLDGAKCDSAIEAILGEGGYVSRDGCISGLRLPDGSEYSSRVSIPGLGAAENAAIAAIVSLAVASAMKRGIRFGKETAYQELRYYGKITKYEDPGKMLPWEESATPSKGRFFDL